MTELGADQIVEAFTNDLRAGLLQGEITLDKIGILRNTADGIVYEKNPEVDAILTPLPILELPIVDTSVAAKEKAAVKAQAASATTGAAAVKAHKATENITNTKVEATAESEKGKEEKKSVFLYALLALFLLLVVGLLTYFFLKPDQSPVAVAGKEDVTSTEIDQDKMEPVDEVYVSDTFKAEDKIEDDGIDENTGEVTSEAEESEQSVVMKDESQEDENESGFDESETVKENGVMDSEDDQGRRETGECIVIVGAFGSTANADRMENKIRELGWKPYREQPIRLTKMGAYVPCDAVKLQNALREIQAEIEPGAWIFKEK